MGNEQQHAGGSRGHYKLEAWKRARKLVLSVYKLTQVFPKEETFGLTAQMRRAAVSIRATAPKVLLVQENENSFIF